MNDTPETDAAAKAGAYMKDGDYSSTQGKQFVHIDDARKLEIERDQARRERDCPRPQNDLIMLERERDKLLKEIDQIKALLKATGKWKE